MKVAITGADGYLGSKVCVCLLSQGIQVVPLTINEEKDSFYIHTDFSVDNLTELFTEVDIVLHLAAVRGGKSISDFTLNELITENVLLAMMKANVKRFVYSSSIAVYSDVKCLPWKEDSLLNPVSLYGLSKIICEGLFNYYSRIYGLSGIILRFAPVYGEDDNNKRMIANFVKQAINHEQLLINTKSSAKRDFIYREDVVNAINWSLYLKNKGVCVYNIGSGEQLTNLEIAQIVNEAMGNPIPIEYNEMNPEIMPPAYCNIDKAKRDGFTPHYTLKDGMKRIAVLEGVR